MTDTLAGASGRHAAPFRDDAPTAPTGGLVLARAARHRAHASLEPEPLSPHRRLLRRVAGERGAATAEYAVATMAAVGFAGLLIVILRGDEVRGILTELVRNALTVG
ncbi:Protein of unknown function [Microterricola viridarii]|uniref:DUF4244 domain-containing protein n=1 Tax=Microterricola viridarii TaxID=412690 RepID=A0A1H1Z018_9MICO|nr:DUF4244 domain-containing protein [Microterricola viridarii]SDT27145.1 Protein of unknown function [Microterricola viridarii]